MYMQHYNTWRGCAIEDPALQAELKLIEADENEIKERFTTGLTFGTAGLRGVLGAGTSRMNIYTVGKATAGLAQYLKKAGLCGGVAIAYDSRNNSLLFAKRAASVLAAAGIKSYIYKMLMPTPALSFAVRALRCAAGIMVTASHNPAKYNGYKVYGPDGCQITTAAANAILAEIEKVDYFTGAPATPFEVALESGAVKYITGETEDAYYEEVKKQSIHKDALAKSGLKIVFTPLNGTGNLPVRKVLESFGAQNISIVKEQELPDGNFTTCPYPNPELKEALALGIAQCRREGADLLLATDPDADRIGTAVKDAATEGGYRLLTGNEIGVLLTNYILSQRAAVGTLPQNPVVVRSVVTTTLADKVAAEYGANTKVVLTGFKYIGETIAELEKTGEENGFILGFEESYGYLAGTYVRDKDAVVAALLICEMAGFYHGNGSSLPEELAKIHKKYGVYLHKVDSFEFEGLAGMQKMQDIMAALRKTAPANLAGKQVEKFADYETQTIKNLITGEEEVVTLPKADILVYSLLGGSEVIVRPSGTEPKIKVYYTATGKSEEAAAQEIETLQKAAKQLVFAGE